MGNILISNIIITLQLLSVYYILGIATMFLGAFHNVKYKKEIFEWKRLKSGLIDMVVLSLGLILGVTAFSILPDILLKANVGQDIYQALEGFTVIAIYGILALAISLYAKKFLDKLSKVFKVIKGNKEENKSDNV